MFETISNPEQDWTAIVPVRPTQVGQAVRFIGTGFGQATGNTVGLEGVVVGKGRTQVPVRLDRPDHLGRTHLRTNPVCLARTIEGTM